MAEETTYTKEQLEGLSRLALRKIARSLGMDGTTVTADTKPRVLIDWILTHSGGASEAEEPAEKKTRGRKPGSKSGKSILDKRRRKTEDVEEESVVESDETGGVPAELLKEITDKIDDLGNVYTQNQAQLVVDIEQIDARLYCVIGMIMQLFQELHKEEIIQTDGTEELEALEKECEPAEAKNVR